MKASDRVGVGIIRRDRGGARKMDVHNRGCGSLGEVRCVEWSRLGNEWVCGYFNLVVLCVVGYK